MPIQDGPLKAEVAFCVRGMISPLLANIFLHHVLDEWYESTVRPRLRGRSTLVWFADDFVWRSRISATPSGSWRYWESGCTVRAYAPPREGALCRLPRHPAGG